LPWGTAIAPVDLGKYAAELLVGNIGDGTISAFDMQDHNHSMGKLLGIHGKPITITDLRRRPRAMAVRLDRPGKSISRRRCKTNPRRVWRHRAGAGDERIHVLWDRIARYGLRRGLVFRHEEGRAREHATSRRTRLARDQFAGAL